MTDLVPAARFSDRAELAAMEYKGPESLGGALLSREKVTAAAELAKRAGLETREYLWTAREAERALGRMINAARAAGDLAGHGGNRSSQYDTDLNDIGISNDLATHSVALAEIPEDAWAKWHESDTEPTRAAVAKSVRVYRDALAAMERTAAERGRLAREAERDAAEAHRRANELRKQQPPPDIPALTDDETSMMGADIILAATQPEPAELTPSDSRPQVRSQETLVRAMSAMAVQIANAEPVIRADEYRDADVMAARDAARRLTDSVATWLRSLNTLYQETAK